MTETDPPPLTSQQVKHMTGENLLQPGGQRLGVEKIALAEAFDSITEHWSPHLAGAVNDHAIKLAKTSGEFVWHQHKNTDELFLVQSGTLRLEFRERDNVTLTAGEFVVVPQGTEHRPVAEPEAELLLVEPAETVNTGDTQSEQTQKSYSGLSE
jgi:Mannose-6-phosphate isomerase